MPLLKCPKTEETRKSFCWFLFCCLGSSSFLMTVSIPYSGFVPGQKIPISIEINNLSHVDVKSTKITLKGLHTFKFDYPYTSKQVEKYRLDYKLAPGVKSGKCLRLEESLRIPEMLTPSNDTHSKMFQISYVLKVTASVNRHMSPFIHIPITVGSFPLKFKEENRDEMLQSSSRIFDCGSKTKTAQTLYNEIIRLNEF